MTRPDFERIMDGAGVALAAFDHLERCTWSNRAWRQLLGPWPMAGEAVSIAEMVAPGAAAPAVAAWVRARSGTPTTVVCALAPPDGEPREVEFTVSPLDNGAIAVARDVTVQRRDATLKDDFIAVVNHELRTPLTSVSGALGLMLGGVVGELPEQARSLAELAHKNCMRLARLIDDLLDVQKIGAGAVAYRMVPVDVVAAVGGAVESNSAFARHYSVSTRVDAPGAAVTVLADADRLQQVLLNLLSNAVKYSPPSGSVDVAVTVRGDIAVVEVADRGKGIPPAFESRVFGKFAQADSSTTRRKGGTGLGLAISKSIVEGMGGEIGFRNRSGGGTVFWFSLPLAIEGAAEREPVLLHIHDEGGPPLAAAPARTRRVSAADTAWSLSIPTGVRAVAVDACAMTGRSLVAVQRQRGDATSLRTVVVGGEGRAIIEVACWLTPPLVPAELAQALRVVVRRAARRPRVLWVGGPARVADVTAAMLSAVAEFVVPGHAQALAADEVDGAVVDLSDPSFPTALIEMALVRAVAQELPVIVIASPSHTEPLIAALQRAAAVDVGARLQKLVGAPRTPEVTP